MADTLGNLLSRCCGKSLNPEQTFPAIDSEAFSQISCLDVTKKLLSQIQELPSSLLFSNSTSKNLNSLFLDICQSHYQEYNFYKAGETIMTCLHSANLFFETLKPWELKKSPEKIDELRVVLHLAMESLRVSAILLQPLVPKISQQLLNKLNVPENKRYFKDLGTFSWNDEGFKTRPLSGDSTVLFKRIIGENTRKRSVQ